MRTKEIAIFIPERLNIKLQLRAQETGFDTVQEYVIFVLNEVVREDQVERPSELTEEQEDKIEETLRGLGYL